MAVIIGIIWVVLAKPTIDSTQFATNLFRPGGFSRPGCIRWSATPAHRHRDRTPACRRASPRIPSSAKAITDKTSPWGRIEFGVDQAFAPVRTSNRDERHRSDRMRPARLQQTVPGTSNNSAVPMQLAATPLQNANPADQSPARTQNTSPVHQ